MVESYFVNETKVFDYSTTEGCIQQTQGHNKEE